MSTSEEGDLKILPPDGSDPAANVDDSASKANADGLSRLKRTACILCRKRKLKCDAARPKCSTCLRLGHECEYNEIRKKSGPKRGYVKALEARLASVETQLKTSNVPSDGPQASSNRSPINAPSMENRYPPASNTNPQIFPNNDSTSPDLDLGADFDASPNMDPSMSFGNLIALGLDEPLPPQEAVNDLYEIYFQKVHPTQPMIHKARFMASLNLAPQFRPPIALRYAMWTLAAAVSDQYSNMQEHFYQRARKYAQQDEMRGFGEATVSLYYTQAWILLCVYEFKNMHFPRAWLSTGRAVRLAQMQGLHRLDGVGLEVKQCLQPAKDWTDKEERRRTFWMAFWEDRCASIGTGWPMTIDEADISTNLPSSEQAYHSGQPENTPTLNEVITGQQSLFSNFGGAIVLTALFGRNLLHLHRPSPEDREEDLNGGFWERHRAIDAILLNINLNLPDNQRIPRGLPDPNVIYLNMCIHTSVICLHQAAIFKIDKNGLPASLGQESKIRCVTAAAEIASIMRSISHCELGILNPFTTFCLYVASRVFVQYLKSRKDDQNILGSLHFLLSAMNAMKKKNPLSESFLAQLDVDLEAAGIPSSYSSNATESLSKKGVYPYKNRSADDGDHHCGPAGIANPAGLEPSTTIPTNMQPNIGSSNASEVTLPYNQHSQPQPNTYHVPDTSLGIVGAQSDNSRNPSLVGEEMDYSPGHSGNDSTPSVFTQRSGSTGGTAYTPPQKGDGGSNLVEQYNQLLGDFQQDSHGFGQLGSDNANQPQIDIPELGFYSSVQDFQMFADTTGLSPKNPNMDPAPMTQQEFETFTRQFFPTTPGRDPLQVAESFTSLTGMTPGTFNNEEWNQLMEGMVGWENDNPRPGQAWATGRGA